MRPPKWVTNIYHHPLRRPHGLTRYSRISTKFVCLSNTNSLYPFSVTKFIRIGIADKNDSPPHFDKALYETEVDENEELHHTVLTVTAKDDHEVRYRSINGLPGTFKVGHILSTWPPQNMVRFVKSVSRRFRSVKYQLSGISAQ
uniref:Cadherin domain-containing protein n=1 Tax=Timema tahoe TaxID=61484 RepID=A0A7R9IBZ5_9NEOP|nr:unnamed protein product [Timema tahoe]